MVKEVFDKRNCILLSSVYTQIHADLDYICPQGHKCSISFNSFKRGHGCKICAQNSLSLKFRLKFEKVQEIFQKHGCVLLSKKYENHKTLLQFICKCGKQDFKSINNFLKNSFCKTCGRERSIASRKLPIEYVQTQIKNNNYELISQYINTNTPLTLKCPRGHIWETTFGNFSQGHRCFSCAHEFNRGQNHYAWNPLLTDEDRAKERGTQNQIWRQSVKIRDNFRCVCGKKGYCEAHHLNSWNWDKDNRYNISNGITLCKSHHQQYHQKYGYGDNTIAQFISWIKLAFPNEFTNITLKLSLFQNCVSATDN